jgi:hypothetical protein
MLAALQSVYTPFYSSSDINADHADQQVFLKPCMVLTLIRVAWLRGSERGSADHSRITCISSNIAITAFAIRRQTYPGTHLPPTPQPRRAGAGPAVFDYPFYKKALF